jgi:hypothetical protein
MSEPTTFDIGIRCVNEDGQWRIQNIMPALTGPDLIAQVGVYQDIFASAIKLLALTYLIPADKEDAEVH